MNYGVIGTGVSGGPCIEYIRQLGNKCIILGDEYPSSLKDIEECDIVVVSPGVPPHHPLILKAQRLDLTIMQDLDLVFPLKGSLVIGVTGTNGKTTFCEKLAFILKQSGISAIVVGNNGVSAVTKLCLETASYDVVIVELSSFMLARCRMQFLNIAIITNIENDHIDWHGSEKQYVEAKCSILKRVVDDGEFFSLGQYKHHFLTDSCIGLHCHFFSETNEILHRVANKCGIDIEESKKIVPLFKSLSFRLEVIESKYYNIINDSKSTNLASTLYALSQIEPSGKLYLVMGGCLKEDVYDEIPLKLKSRADYMYFFGKDGKILHQKSCGFSSSSYFQTLDECIDALYSTIEKNDTILFSPGCSSFDQYKNYEERGLHFNNLIRNKEIL